MKLIHALYASIPILCNAELGALDPGEAMLWVLHLMRQVDDQEG